MPLPKRIGAFFGFIGLTFIVSLTLLLHRWDSLKSESHMTSMLSREALFLLNNLLFLSILVICFWGVIFPLISELFTGQKVTVGPPFYERATAPIFAGLLLLMGVAPLAAWRHSTAKTLGEPYQHSFSHCLSVSACQWSWVSGRGRRCSVSGCALSCYRLRCTNSGVEQWRAIVAPVRTLGWHCGGWQGAIAGDMGVISSILGWC
jgi:cytochrome c biogenesis factor